MSKIDETIRYKQIQIDFDVNLKIENSRKDFSDTDNNVLRRLLGIDNPSGEPALVNDFQNLKEVPLKRSIDQPFDELGSVNDPQNLEETPAEKSWGKSGVALPHGTIFRTTYKGVLYQGKIEDGAWIIQGYEETPFRSPSEAASAIATTHNNGEQTALNGWQYWEVLLPHTVRWRPLKELRKKRPTRRKRSSTPLNRQKTDTAIHTDRHGVHRLPDHHGARHFR